MSGCPQHHPNQPPNLKAAYLRQYLQRLFRVRLVHRQGSLYYLYLMLKLFIGYAGASSGHLSHRFPHHNRTNGATGSSIANPHIAGAHNVQSPSHLSRHYFNPCLYCRYRLLPGHSLTSSYILSARGNLSGQKPRIGFQLSSHPHINHHNPGSHLTGNNIYSRPTTKEIVNHLGGYLLRPVTYPLSHYPMVTSHSNNRLVPDLRYSSALNASQLNGQLLQSTQAPLRFGQQVLPGLSFSHCPFIQRLYHFNYFG
ncbi:hypothetical protein ES703_103605 [subsurface metagenome]